VYVLTLVYSIRPISTYSGQGTAKPGVDSSTHAVIYMAGTMPRVEPNEQRMTKDPIAVIPASPAEKLDKMSRINFGKVYTIEYNVKVMDVGMVTPDSQRNLHHYAYYELTRP
jgi:hypothetical protein